MSDEGTAGRFSVVVAWIGVVTFLGAGMWALVAPESFFDSVAQFDPYNQHLIQDIGAFQIGLGAVILAALVDRRSDALAATLLGAGVGAAAHVVSHVIGRDLGGTPAVDIPAFALLGGLLLVAGVLRRSRGR